MSKLYYNNEISTYDLTTELQKSLGLELRYGNPGEALPSDTISN